MPIYPPNQKIKNAKNASPNAPTPKKNPPAQKQPIGFPENQGDLGILKIQNPNIPRMVKAPTRTGDAISNHVGKVGSAMKKMGMLT